jgi:hypothetical protein
VSSPHETLILLLIFKRSILDQAHNLKLELAVNVRLSGAISGSIKTFNLVSPEPGEDQ